jgi:hypothetical protein
MSESDPTGLAGDAECDGFCQTATALYTGSPLGGWQGTKQTYATRGGQSYPVSTGEALNLYQHGATLSSGLEASLTAQGFLATAGSLQASVSGFANGGSVEGRYGPGAYQEAANTTAGKVVQGVVTGLTDAAGQLPIAAAEVGTDGVQTPAVVVEEITVLGEGRALGQAAGAATDAGVSSFGKWVGAKASDIVRWAESRGWKFGQTENGPIKYFDENGVPRVTIKRGSARTPGSENPHVELRIILSGRKRSSRAARARRMSRHGPSRR